MAVRLTEDVLKQAPEGCQVFDWADLVSGFGVRYTPTQTAFIVQWRDSAGKKPRETLKRWPACSVEVARDLARQRLAAVLGARGSGADIQLRLAMRTWYERESLRKNWRPRYRAKVDAIIGTYFEGLENPRVKLTSAARRAVDELGRKPLAGVSRSDVLAVADHIKPGSAEQFMAIGSSAFNDFYEREWVTGNPFRN